MKHLISIFLLFIASLSFAQKEFHVFPKDAETKKGSPNGDGSFSRPWDLQTALSQSSERVNGGDIIWLHGGVYNGRFKSTLKSSNSKFIIVSAYKKDKVVLNGNTNGESDQVLLVVGNKVVFKNFHITHLGLYSRIGSDPDFNVCSGVNHTGGVAKFQNLSIYNNPGLGFGSWKSTGGSIIEDCLIYNNGSMGEKRGSGEGMYVQNKSEDTRLIRNNIIFNNYYKGIEVWSASSGYDYQFVKNVDITDNILFNNGKPSGVNRDNIIIATNDGKGVNIAKNIKVKNNVMYHNIDFEDGKNYGYGTALAVGYRYTALVEDIVITDNVLLGRNNPLNLTFIKSLDFKRNIVYGGCVGTHKISLAALNSGEFTLDDNRYFTRLKDLFRVEGDKNYDFLSWQKKFNTDIGSTRQKLSSFTIDPVLKVKPLITNANIFNVVLLDKNGKDVSVDFSAYNVAEGSKYKIYDIENRMVVAKSGKISKDMKITFPMGLEAFEKPLHNTIAEKSEDNFGVFRIEFEKPKKKKGFFSRLFGWLF